MLLSCEDGNKQKPARLKTFTWFSPPARSAEKQECKQKKTARRGRAPTWREFAGVGEDREVEGGREGKGRLFLSLQTVYITKEESLEHNRAVPRATAQSALSCCQSLAAAWTPRVFKRPIRPEDYSKARLTCGSAFSKRAPLIKSSLLAVGLIDTTTWNRRCSFLVVNCSNETHEQTLDVAASSKYFSATKKKKKHSLLVLKLHQVKTSFFFVAYKKKGKSGFTLRNCTIAESSVGSLASVGRAW